MITLDALKEMLQQKLNGKTLTDEAWKEIVECHENKIRIIASIKLKTKEENLFANKEELQNAETDLELINKIIILLKKDIKEITKEEVNNLLNIKENEIQTNTRRIVFSPILIHRPYINLLKPIVNLIGEENILIVRFLHAQNISSHIKQTNFQFGECKTDKRLHVTYAIYSGWGKGEIKRVTKLCNNDLKLIEISSYHQEQLIGKVIVRQVPKITKQEKADNLNIFDKAKKYFPNEEILKVTDDGKVYLMNKGHLNCDILQMDEAKLLLTSLDNNYVECRHFLCSALDIFGNNSVFKKNIDNLSDEWVRYCPECNLQLFLQSYFIPAEIITSGFMRRTEIAYLRNKNLDTEQLKLKWQKPKDTKKYLDLYNEHLQRITLSGEIEFNTDCEETFSKCHKHLVEYGLNYSEKGSCYTKLVFWNIGATLLKYTILVAKDLLHTKIQPEHILLAFHDLMEDFTMKLDYIEDKVYGDLDYGVKWRGAIGKYKQCLQFLDENEAYSFEESNITIQDFMTWVQHTFNLAVVTDKEGKTDCRQARNIMATLVKREWIKKE